VENRKALDSFNVSQMLFNICGEELAGIMSYEVDINEVRDIIKEIEAKSGYKIAKVLKEIEGDLLVQ
jgi:hypothetical protein